MSDDLNPHDIRTRKFGMSRRGYDRSEVTEYLGLVADQIASLENDMAMFGERLGQLGITELPDFKAEIDDLGSDISAVLNAAVNAAEGARNRAHADAEAMLADAEAASTRAREDAWTSGTEMLHQAELTSATMLSQAREDALYIRAEAEQDAKRLVTDARRQADEMVRSSREDGEKIVVIAKAESEAILEGARQSAEKAQERARALENRRAELMGELEVAESAMRSLESTRTRAQKTPAVGARVTAGADATRWAEDEGTIRILPPVQPKAGSAPVVDAEEMAAEVAGMRSAVTLPQEPQGAQTDTRDEPGSDHMPADALDAPADSDPHQVVRGEAVSEPEPVDEVAAVTTVVVDAAAESAAEPAPEPEPVAESALREPVAADLDEEVLLEEAVTPAPIVAPVETDKVTIVDGDSGIADLFARLREPVAAAVAETPVAAAVDPVPSDQELQEPVGAEPTERSPLQIVPDLEFGEGFERRDRMLLPVENTGLRGLKRRIVELQNRVLEELRVTDGQYRLGREFVVAMMGDELDDVLRASYRAGHAAAAESLGAPEPQLTGGPNQGAAEAFSVDLHRDIKDAIAAAGEGSRRLSSDVSRVFRGWRTDEAERHVRTAARRAFNDGLLAGYKRLGVAEVELAAPGRCCGECGADTGRFWAPVDEAPPGVDLPPLGPSCSAMVVPKDSSGFDSRPGQ